MEPAGETEEGEAEPVVEASSYGRAERTGDNLCCRKESCARLAGKGRLYAYALLGAQELRHSGISFLT